MERDLDIPLDQSTIPRGEPFTESNTRTVPLEEIQELYSRADASLDPRIKRRYPVLSFEDIRRQHQDEFVGVLPVKLGGDEGIVTARLLVNSSDIYTFREQVEALEKQLPGMFITRRFFGNPPYPSMQKEVSGQG